MKAVTPLSLPSWTFLALVILALRQSAYAAEPIEPDESMRALDGKFLDYGYKASWSPDSKRIAYGGIAPENSLKTYDVASGEITTVTSNAKDPAWRPGKGHEIAYVRSHGNEEEVRVVGVDGRNDRKVADGGMPSWSKRGTVLFYYSRKNRQIMSAEEQKGRFAEASAIAPVLTSLYPALNPQTTHVAVIAEGRLTIFDQLTGTEKRAWMVPGAQGGLPTWSHDGKLVSAAGYGGTDEAELMLLNPATGESARLAGNGYIMPAWSPDGTQVVVDYRPKNGPWSIWLFPAAKLDELKWSKDSLPTPDDSAGNRP
jgi:Tol biopolymer transport system component